MVSRLKHSISMKLLLVVLTTTFIASLAYGGILLAYDLSSYRESKLKDIETQATIIAEVTTPALAFSDGTTAQTYLDLFQTQTDVLHASIFTADQKLFADYSNEENSRAPPSVVNSNRVTHNFTDSHIEIWRPIFKNGQRLGTVYIRSIYQARQRFFSYVVILAGVLLASLCLAFFVAMWFRRSITEPLISVATVAQEVMRNRDYSVRAKKVTDDEIGVLADAFNNMLQEIGRRAAEIEASNQSLEREMIVRQDAEAELQLADRRKDEFLATLAHELRNPLAPIANGIRILQLNDSDPQTRVAVLALMQRQLDQMVRLIDDLLDVSRITTGKMRINAVDVAARTIMQDAIEIAAPQFEAYGNKLTVKMPPHSAYVHADPVRLAQVFSNLLANAAKYTPEGGDILFSAEIADTDIVFSVSDNGLGISLDMQEKIFDMFTQVNETGERAKAGLGVGLALSRHLVKLHGADLLIHSDGIGRGSTFSVQMALTSQPVGDYADNGENRNNSTRKHKILLVDDNEEFVTTLAVLLSAEGHRVNVAHNATAALNIIDEFAPDVVFLDIGMPEMNGYDLARLIREKEVMRHRMLVAVTGWGQDKDRALSKQAGFDHHLVKPVKLNDLLRLL